MIYISYGVPKSASTFAYVITSTIFKTAGCATVQLSENAKGARSRLNYIDPISWKAIERVRSEIGDQSAVIKTHSAPDERLKRAIENGEILASAIVRDPRDIALSLLDHAERSRRSGVGDFAKFHSATDVFELLDEQIKRLSKWTASSKVLLLTYDEVCFDTESAVRRIILQAGLPVAPETVMSALPNKEEILQFNKGARNRYESEMREEIQTIFLERYADFYRDYLRQWPTSVSSTNVRHGATAEKLRAGTAEAVGTAGAEAARSVAGNNRKTELSRQLISALFRVLLFREPESGEIDEYVRSIQSGQPIESVIRRLLGSTAFSANRELFLKTYLRAPRRSVAMAAGTNGVAAMLPHQSAHQKPTPLQETPPLPSGPMPK
jgi:hypothetical protein